MRCPVFKLAIIVGIVGVGKSTVLKKRKLLQNLL
jgi:adenylate kinase